MFYRPQIPNPQTISDRLTNWLTLVATVIQFHWRKSVMPHSIAALVEQRIAVLVQKLRRLDQAWRAGTLKPSRPRRPREAQTRPARTASRFSQLPSQAGWLPRVIPDCAWYGAAPLRQLLDHEDMAEFVAAVPQAARLLRPLHALFGTQPPDYLKLPPRPPRPKRARAPRTTSSEPRPARAWRIPPPAPPPLPWSPTSVALQSILWGPPPPSQKLA